MISDDVILYNVPGQTQIHFVFEPQQREFHLKLTYGKAKIKIGNKCMDIHQGQNFVLSLWDCLTPILRTATDCEIEVQGNHYINAAFTKIGQRLGIFFAVSQVPNGFVFLLGATLQLHIFVNNSGNSVQLETLRGKPEVLGRPLVLNQKYSLTPGSSTLLNSRFGNYYTVAIYGENRRIQISLLDQAILKRMKNVYVRIRSLRQLAIDNNYPGPITFVVGTECVGKTSVCNFILNKAVEDERKLVYIDLDVCRNMNNVPGTISLREIKCADYSSPTAFENDRESILLFGCENFNDVNIPFYLGLVHKISSLLDEIQSYNSENNKGAVIDMCGTLGKDLEIIKNILNLFVVNLIVVVGDESYFDFVKNSLPDYIQESMIFERVPPLQNTSIKTQHENSVTIAYSIVLKKYFDGEKFKQKKAFRANFADFKVYKFNPDYLTGTSNNHCINDRGVHLNVGQIECDPSIEKCVLGVVRSNTTIEELAEIDYFVFFAEVNVKEKYAVVVSPVTEQFKDKILILTNQRVL